MTDPAPAYTHANCGGLLIPIDRPSWWPNQPSGSVGHAYQNAMLARCTRCGLAGEVLDPKQNGAAIK